MFTEKQWFEQYLSKTSGVDFEIFWIYPLQKFQKQSLFN